MIARLREAVRNALGGLGVRQALLLSVTLLPLGLILLIQIAAVEREVVARSQSALTGATLAAGSKVMRQIEEARGAAHALALVIPGLAGDPAACSRALRSYVRETGGRVSFAGYVTARGAMTCLSTEQPLTLPLPPIGGTAGQEVQPRLTVNRTVRIEGDPVVGVSHPVRDSEGRILGVLSLSLPHRGFAALEIDKRIANPIDLITFDADGNIVTASSGIRGAESRIPVDRSLRALATEKPVAFNAVSVSGAALVYSVVPIVEGSLYLMGSWRNVDAGRSSGVGGLPPVVFAALMWLASLGTAILGAERLVSRHVRALGRSMTAFAGGNRLVSLPDLRDAPSEMRAAGEAYARLTESILQDEAELENAIHHRDVALREVHHRVKNNLQLIASIMNLQMRKARSPEARSLLRGLQDRVMSLATIHKELYQTSGETDIRADELLADITRQVLKLATGAVRRFQVTTEFRPVVLTPDQAVPLALLVTEALTNAIKYAGAVEGRSSRLLVALRLTEDGAARFEIVNTLPSPTATIPEDEGLTASTGLGSQLLAAFAQQVGGQLATEQTDEEYLLRLDFPVRSDHPDADAPGEDGEAPGGEGRDSDAATGDEGGAEAVAGADHRRPESSA